MSDTFSRKEIGKGVFLNTIVDTKFKSNRLSINLVLPLNKQTAAQYALIPFLLRKGYKDCPDFTKLNARLAELYGASLDCDVRKAGDNQILNLSIQGLDNRFALQQEDITCECTKLLCGLLFAPNLQNGVFGQEDFLLEQKYLVDTIESEINEKRSYALNRMISAMYQNNPYGVNKYGDIASAKALTPETVTRAYHYALKTARVEILFVGCQLSKASEQILQQAFSSVEREGDFGVYSSLDDSARDVQEIVEKMDVTQSKLVLGFKTPVALNDQRCDDMRFLAALFGGTPFSRLFVYVREKLSLCYYCAARYDESKGLLMVDCGIEAPNKQKALEEIVNQLQICQRGEFTDEEFASSRLSLENSYRSVNDSPGTLEGFYLTQILLGRFVTPQQVLENLQAVTKEKVVQAAKTLRLDTVYFLTSQDDERSEAK